MFLDPQGRGSKRQKDLADLARILEARPAMREQVPADALQRLIWRLGVLDVGGEEAGGRAPGAGVRAGGLSLGLDGWRRCVRRRRKRL